MEKPEVVIEFFGESGNIFFIEFHAMLAITEKYGKDKTLAINIPKEVRDNAKDYYDAIRIIGKYVELIPAEADLQDEYYAGRPNEITDGSYVAEIIKRATEGGKNER